MLGTPVLRLRGDYLAIVTLGFGEIVRIVITNNAFGITNGAAGLPKAGEFIVPSRSASEWLADNVYFPIPRRQELHLHDRRNVYWYYIIVLLCLLTIFVVRRLDNSRLGRSWAAMREDEVAASSVGVSITAAEAVGVLAGRVVGRHRGPDLRELPAVRQPRVVHVHGVGVHRLHDRHRRYGLDSGCHRRRDHHPGHPRLHPGHGRRRSSCPVSTPRPRRSSPTTAFLCSVSWWSS